MTYEKACSLLGLAALPLRERESREALIDEVVRLSGDETEPLDPDLMQACRERYQPTRMTYEEACGLLGFEEPPELELRSRWLLVRVVEETTDNGQTPIDPGLAHLYRNQIEEFY